MTGQKPSIGRVVHYVSHGTPVRPDGSHAFTRECRAAIITEVAGEGQVLLAKADGLEHSSDEVVVGLCVLNPTGQFFDRAAYHDGGETLGDPNCPNQPHSEMPFRYCPQAGCGWREAAHQGGTWHWPERA